MLPSTSLFSSTSDIDSQVPQQQQLSRHHHNISNLYSAFDISSRRSQQNIYIYVRERRPLRPRRACCSAARPHRFAGAMPTILRPVERVRSAAPRITLPLLRLRLSAAPSILLCGLAGSGLVLYALVSPPMTFTFIFSTPPRATSLSFNFSFQLLDWPVGSDSLNITPRARWVVCPLYLWVVQAILRNIDEYWKLLVILMNIDTYWIGKAQFWGFGILSNIE